MQLTKKMVTRTGVGLALAALVGGCQLEQTKLTGQSTLAQQLADISASHYHTVQLAGMEYQIFSDQAGLHVRQSPETKDAETKSPEIIGHYPGAFIRLTVQQLADDSLLLAAMDDNNNSLHLWQLKPQANEPLQLLRRQLISSRVVDDLCFYQSSENQQLSLFLLGGRGGADQLLLQQQQQWLDEPVVIRELNVPYDSTACVADPYSGALYIAEADRAIWRYQAEPEADEGRSLVQVNAPFGQLQGEVKALQLLADGSLLALEEQPARILQLSRSGDLLTTLLVPALPEASGLSVNLQANKAALFVSSEQAGPVQQLSLSLSVAAARSSRAPVVQLMPTLQTEAARQRGDVMDDPAVWHHPAKPELSLILGTDKRAGLDVYNLQGERVQQLPVGRLNNVDVRYNLSWQGRAHDLAVASLRDDNSLQLFAIDNNGVLHNAGKIATAMTEIYGLCLYQSADSGNHYVFVNDKSGLIEQYQLSSDGSNWQGRLVRSLQVPSQPEGCVADDKRGILFVGEEDQAIWRFAAAADAATTGEAILRVDGERLVDDIEGIALAEHNGNSYLVVSSQGNDSYLIYDAAPPYAERLHFRIGTNPELGIDGASETDGLDVTTRSLGPGFEQGALVVQDGRNRMPEQGQNLKLVPWYAILQQLQ
ncbi:3-phytase [Arsukibacterium tuosuense]|uniref:3-phytase n=1 Tax=Arsukibacterium tuosuense TaxID=1323745 RepID=A0A285JJ94_9GAMM|nr:phytase [Arsukibacterium tuosuense]SNY60345.1 3-phytase [Arsukibacterium tuosuense]